MKQENSIFLSGLNVLMVDDSRSFLAGLAAILSPYVRGLDTCTSGADAIRFMMEKTPDILITDIEMPDMSGLELVKQLRANPIFNTVPILVLTGKQDTDLMVSAIHAGADSFLVKNSVRECVLPQLLALARVKDTYQSAIRGKQLEAVQALIGTYKHEFGNAIAAIDGKVRKIARAFPETARDESVASLHSWISRMAETLKKLDALRKYEEKEYLGSSQMIKTE